MSNLCIDLNEIASNVGRPHHDKRTIGDPFKTIFVGRLNFNTSEDRLYREFQIVGQVETVRIVKDQKTRKSKGYGFVEFRDERDANEAVKRLDGRKIDGFRVIVDREFGRTKHSWYPKRLGGGKGDSRRDRSDEQILRMI